MMAQQSDAHIGFRIPSDVKRRVEEQAQRERRSISNWILLALEEKLEQLSPTHDDRRRGRKSAA